MRKFYLVAVLGVPGLVLALLVAHTLSHREPSYQGKLLSAWLQDLDDQHPGPANDAAEEAIRHIGAEAMPQVIRMLRERDSSWPVRINEWVHAHHLMGGTITPVYVRQHQALLACFTMGPKAVAAIPALIDLLNKPHKIFFIPYIVTALGKIGPESLPPLIQSLGVATNEAVKTLILGELGDYPSNAPVVVPILLKSLQDRSAYCRTAAAWAVGRIAQQEELCVPALTNLLTDTHVDAQWCACLALGNFKERAKPAIPLLLQSLEDGDAEVRACAAIALVKIDPEDVPRRKMLMPYLIQNLEGIDSKQWPLNFRSATIEIIGLCGEQAKAAVPALVKCLADKEVYVREIAGKALKQIDPEAAAKAGVK